MPRIENGGGIKKAKPIKPLVCDGFHQLEILPVWHQGYKTFFMFNSNKHEISTAHEN